MPDGNIPLSRYSRDVDTRISFTSLIGNNESTTLRIRDAFRETIEGRKAGIERFAQTQEGVKAHIHLDFHSRQFRDEVVEQLGHSNLGSTFLFASMQKNTLDCEITGKLSDVLNDMSVVLQASGGDAYIMPVGGSKRILDVAEEDVMSAFSLWMSGRMSGQIASHEL